MNGVSNSTVTGKPATTTGIADIDKILGGGIHTSSSILIKADKKTKYSQLINQYFCASAIHLNQDLFCAGVDVIQNTANLMSVVSVESGQAVETVAPSRPLGAVRDDMKIAWRYKNLGMASSSISTGTPSIVFDVTKKIDPAILDKIVGDGRLTLFPIVESRKSDGIFI